MIKEEKVKFVPRPDMRYLPLIEAAQRGEPLDDKLVEWITKMAKIVARKYDCNWSDFVSDSWLIFLKKLKKESAINLACPAILYTLFGQRFVRDKKKPQFRTPLSFKLDEEGHQITDCGRTTVSQRNGKYFPKKGENFGESNGRAKLNEQTVVEIRQSLRDKKYTAQRLSEIYEVARSTIYAIKNNYIWKPYVKKQKIIKTYPNMPTQICQSAGYNKGESNGNVKLNEQKVTEIKKHLTENKYTDTKLAKMYEVSRTVIYNLKNGFSWK